MPWTVNLLKKPMALEVTGLREGELTTVIFLNRHVIKLSP